MARIAESPIGVGLQSSASVSDHSPSRSLSTSAVASDNGRSSSWTLLASARCSTCLDVTIAALDDRSTWVSREQPLDLRVSYAAWWKRHGANNSEVADLLRDTSERMGTHYTRHVDSGVNVTRAFSRLKDGA